MTGCRSDDCRSARCPQARTARTGPATPYATKKSEPANSLSERQFNQRRYDGLLAPTTAGAHGTAGTHSPYGTRHTVRDEEVGTREQPVRAPIQHSGAMTGCSLRRLQHRLGVCASKSS